MIAADPPSAEDDAFEVAIEHLAWCIRQGQTRDEIWRCLLMGRVPPNATWEHLIWLIAASYEPAREPQSPLRRAA